MRAAARVLPPSVCRTFHQGLSRSSNEQTYSNGICAMKTARQSGQFRSDESGATAVEFGLVAAMFCFLVVGLTDFGMSYWQTIQVGNAARAGSLLTVPARGLRGLKPQLFFQHFFFCCLGSSKLECCFQRNRHCNSRSRRQRDAPLSIRACAAPPVPFKTTRFPRLPD